MDNDTIKELEDTLLSEMLKIRLDLRRIVKALTRIDDGFKMFQIKNREDCDSDIKGI